LKRVVVDEHLDELEVHPPGLYQRLVDVCIASSQELLQQPELFVETTCPACASPDMEPAFEKYGYTYWSCRVCATLFVSPRPSDPLMVWYLLQSPAATFRNGAEYGEVMGQRVAELAMHRAEWIAGLCKDVGVDGQPLVDVETRSPDYLEGLQRRQIGPLVSVKPICSLPESWTMSASSVAITSDLRDLEGANAKLVTAFDVLEHHTCPFDLFLAAHEAMVPGGILVITTRSSSGFDVQVLWEQCATIFPAEHINLVSVEGMRTLLTRAGFEILEASTPGQLDVQMIERTLCERQDIEVPRFLRYFLKHRDRFAKHRLQQFLQENLLSSHLRVVARKRTAA